MKKLTHRNILCYLAILALAGIQSCVNKLPDAAAMDLRQQEFETENVVIVVIDGPRYVDTWGMEKQPNIPKMANELLPQGTFFTNFQNKGRTITVAGHTAIATGNYQPISNDGSELPNKPSILHRYLRQTSKPSSKAVFLTSKKKLNVLAKVNDPDWPENSIPYALNEKDRTDVETYEEVINTLNTKKPNIMLVQFKGPDIKGHADDWNGYLHSLRETDSLVHKLWQHLQQDEFYKDKTALLVTNDHGRHSDGHRNAFEKHGDSCKGCRHISLLALGPDFEKGKLVTKEYEQIDIAPTIGILLGLDVPTYDGGTLILPLLQKDTTDQLTLNSAARTD